MPAGEIVGHDLAYGSNTLLGMAFSRQQQQGWLPAMGDRVRGYQYESQSRYQYRLYSFGPDGRSNTVDDIESQKGRGI